MDYEKKYNEALERARYVLHTVETAGCAMHKDLLTEIFPGLAESEDERIRKNCIHFLELQKQHHAATFEIEECIAWLEKQIEQKPAEWSEEDEKTLDCIINVLDRLGFEEFCKSSRDQDVEEKRFYYKEIQCLKRLKSLRPSWKPSKEQMEAFKNSVEHIPNAYYDDMWELYEQLKKLM